MIDLGLIELLKFILKINELIAHSAFEINMVLLRNDSLLRKEILFQVNSDFLRVLNIPYVSDIDCIMFISEEFKEK